MGGRNDEIHLRVRRDLDASCCSRHKLHCRVWREALSDGFDQIPAADGDDLRMKFRYLFRQNIDILAGGERDDPEAVRKASDDPKGVLTY
jgi:hypothetical protein